LSAVAGIFCLLLTFLDILFAFCYVVDIFAVAGAPALLLLGLLILLTHLLRMAFALYALAHICYFLALIFTFYRTSVLGVLSDYLSHIRLKALSSEMDLVESGFNG
jgi:hypothetical protein